LEPLANSEVHNDESYGVLKLTLRPKGYEWRYLSAEGGEFSDSGSARCH
jgi:acid phosphatase type 7